LYTGYTTDPVRRVKEHNRGVGSKFTRGRRPVRLAYLEEAASKGAALRREHEIKTFGRGEKLLLCRGFSKENPHSSR
jgi:putative endonuclease